MKLLREFKTLTEAEFSAGLLVSKGIRCEAKDGLYHVRPRIGPSVWLEREEDRAAAIEILDKTPRRNGLAWSCPSCQSDNEAQFDACWSCGATRG